MCLNTFPFPGVEEVWSWVFNRSKGCIQSTAATPAPVPAAAWSCEGLRDFRASQFPSVMHGLSGGTYQSSRREEARLILFRHRHTDV